MSPRSWSRWLTPVVFGAAGMTAAWGCTSDGNLGAESRADAGLPGVQPGQCGEGIDRNGNGVIDEGCICIPGESEACFDGPVSARHTGQCQDGTIVCGGVGEFGTWGSNCVGAVLPATEVCNGVDDNCDGAVDEGCSCPTQGEVRPCGQAGLPLPCKQGQQTCSGGTWSQCVGQVEPQAEQCGNGIDDNCNGQIDELCDCVPSAEICGDGKDNDCDGQIDEQACISETSTEAGAPDTGVPDTGALEGGTDTGPSTEGGSVTCAGAGDWNVQVPAGLYSGDVNSPPGGMVRGAHLALDGQGVLVAGQIVGAKLDWNSFAAESTEPNASGGAIPQDLFVLGLTPTGTMRFGYAPTMTPYAPPNPFNAVPVSYAAGLVPDGAGGFWVAGEFHGNMQTGPGKQYSTPVPVSPGLPDGDALLVHGDGSGGLVDSRVFGRDGQMDAFGQVALRGNDLIVTVNTSDFFSLDGVPLLPPSAHAKSFLDIQPGSGSYAPVRIDYVDSASGGSLDALMAAAGGNHLLYGVAGGGPLSIGGSNVGLTELGVTALLTPTSAGYDAQTFVGTEGYYTYATSVRLNGSGDILLSGNLRGTVSFGGAPLSSGGATANDGFGFMFASLAPDGSHRWSKALVPSPIDPFHSLSGVAAIGDDGAVYVASMFGNQAGSSLDLGSGPVTMPATAVIFAVYDSTGALKWSKVEDHSAYKPGTVLTVADVAPDGCGGFYVTGDYWMGTSARGLFVRHVTTQ